MYARWFKRVIDIFISIVVAIIFLIPSILIAIIIKLDSRGPVIFSHIRCGRDNKPFTLYKFRTFHTYAPADLSTFEVKDACHITRAGKILRKLSLDELPQVWNVLRGDMSIIGPRPVLYKEEFLIKRRTANGSNLLRPGITGWAQVRGRDTLGPVKKSKYDGEYKEHLSFKFDVYCLFLTVWTVLALRGHAEGHSGKLEKMFNDEFKNLA